jgi:putative SOS response-associated peptidase YedK
MDKGRKGQSSALVHPAKTDTLAFAGVWQVWDKGEAPLTTCAIVTTAANKTMSAIHHRVPVVLSPEDWALWLGESGKGAATLMTAPPEDALAFHRVDTKVNSNKAKGPDLVEPLA